MGWLFSKMFTGVFAFPLPWVPGKARGVNKARYLACFDVYETGFGRWLSSSSRGDTTDMVDLQQRINEGLLTRREVQAHARQGLIYLFRNPDAPAVLADVSKMAWSVSLPLPGSESSARVLEYMEMNRGLNRGLTWFDRTSGRVLLVVDCTVVGHGRRIDRIDGSVEYEL